MPIVPRSSDGRKFAFIRTSSVSVKEIWLVETETGHSVSLTSDRAYISGLSWSPNGSEIIFSSNRFDVPQLRRLAVNGGTLSPLLGTGDNVIYPDIFRKRNRLTYMQVVGFTSVWRRSISKAAGKNSAPKKLIYSARHDIAPQYSPDGRKIAFASDRSGTFEIWISNDDGSNPAKLTSFRCLNGAGCPRWSPDGKHIVFDCRAAGNANVYIVRSEGGMPSQITDDECENVTPSYSNDDKWIYFASNRTGEWQVWKTTPRGKHAVQVTKKGGFAPFESQGGRFVYYAKGRTIPGVWRVPVNGGEESKVLDSPFGGYWAYWALVRRGIYFLDFLAPNLTPLNVASPVAVRFLNLATGATSEVAMLDKVWTVLYPGLAVSPNCRWMLYPQLERSGSNVMVVEKFK
ncbi:MAG: TolB family protein [Terriglobia bacterium]